MDKVTTRQYHYMKDMFARQGTEIGIAYTPAGDIDYMYEVGTLLALDRDDNVGRLQRELPRLSRTRRVVGDLVALSIDDVADDFLTVPGTLDRLEEGLGKPGRPVGSLVEYGPNHVFHIAKICPAGEPEVPSGYPTQPWPPATTHARKHGATVLVVDTGLLENIDPVRYPWLKDVEGDPDKLGPMLAGNVRSIPQYVGHGTFAAGVLRCMAPGATVYVGDHFTDSGGELESVMIAKLEELVQKHKPDVVCLPAGTYTRENWAPLGFDNFHKRYPDIVLVASAGNDSTSRGFYPAAMDWVVGVGALGTDQEHPAWFSNFGRSADIWALGESIVNAYASGLYTYQEPPKEPAQQTFKGMARWDGTSYSAPLIAGLIADEMDRNGVSAEQAWQAVKSTTQNIPGAGPSVILPL